MAYKTYKSSCVGLSAEHIEVEYDDDEEEKEKGGSESGSGSDDKVCYMILCFVCI